ncbi:MAG: LLM class F420-dependent oxidoreductase [Acidimicrobiales bacterium]|nr:LLM class F420-dependent oxidoreductase [Acidimicrobiales bacterium]
MPHANDPKQSERWGITIPFEGVPLYEQGEWYKELQDLGYSDVWSAEADGTDAFVPLAIAAMAAPELRLGSAVVPAFTRGPALLAMQVDTLSELAQGRFAFGIGTSSNVIVERWNDIRFEAPLAKVRDTVRFLKEALTGQKVKHEYETFKVEGFKLGRRRGQGDVRQVPPIMVAGLRPHMLQLAGREAEGAILNWLGANDVKKAVTEVLKGSKGEDREIIARIFVIPSEDADTARAVGRMAIAAYLNVPVYAAFHEWLGRGEQLSGMWEAWKSGDRQKALQEIPDQVVDDLIVHGSYQECKEHIRRYVENGVTTPVMAVIPVGVDDREAIRALRP